MNSPMTPAARTPEHVPSWVGTVLESCIRNVALGRIASHSSVTPEMVAEWRRLNPDRPAARTRPPTSSTATGHDNGRRAG